MLTGLATVAVGLGVLVASLWAVQRRLVYLPTRGIPAPPADVDEIHFTTEDGLPLAAWMVPASATPSTITVVVFPGNAGNRADRLPLARRLASRGLEVLLVEYRGYGSNPGSPDEKGLIADGRAALRFLDQRGRRDLVYLGESLGAAVAVALAAERAPLLLALRSPFSSLADVVDVHLPFLPARLILRDRYPVADRIPTVRCPVLVVAGSADTTVPAEMSRRVFAAAPEPKRLAVVEGADHNDPLLTSGPRLVTELIEFLGDVVDR